MKRLHHLSERQLREWQRVRQEEGSKMQLNCARG